MPQLITPGVLANRIEAVVRELGGSASHGELLSRLTDLNLRGHCKVGFHDVNVMLFVGCAPILAEALTMLLASKRLSTKACPPMILVADGSPFPKAMPLMNQKPPRGGFKQPHFAPCLLCFPGS